MTDEYGNDVRLTKTKEQGFVGERIVQEEVVPKQSLKAMVKGSIYETGETVSVFGTCLNATDEPLPQGTWGTLNAWYPNGTMFFSNATMNELQPGYYEAVSTMSAVQGTYLTEFTCHVNGTGEFAKAWGEWQNPLWVQRIANISDQIADLNTTIVNDFNLTWAGQNETNILINATYQNITQQLIYVANVANASVDRNDSYLAYLLHFIINGTNIPVNYTLNVVTDADPPILHSMWHVRAVAYNEYGVLTGMPVVSCYVTTVNLPPSTNQLMTPNRVKINNTWFEGFEWSEKITLMNQFDYNVSCVYN